MMARVKFVEILLTRFDEDAYGKKDNSSRHRDDELLVPSRVEFSVYICLPNAAASRTNLIGPRRDEMCMLPPHILRPTVC